MQAKISSNGEMTFPVREKLLNNPFVQLESATWHKIFEGSNFGVFFQKGYSNEKFPQKFPS